MHRCQSSLLSQASAEARALGFLGSSAVWWRARSCGPSKPRRPGPAPDPTSLPLEGLCPGALRSSPIPHPGRRRSRDRPVLLLATGHPAPFLQLSPLAAVLSLPDPARTPTAPAPETPGPARPHRLLQGPRGSTTPNASSPSCGPRTSDSSGSPRPPQTVPVETPPTRHVPTTWHYPHPLPSTVPEPQRFYGLPSPLRPECGPEHPVSCTSPASAGLCLTQSMGSTHVLNEQGRPSALPKPWTKLPEPVTCLRQAQRF